MVSRVPASAAALLASALLAACGTGASRPDGAGIDAGPDGNDGTAYLGHLAGPGDFARLAGEEWGVKFLGAVTGKTVAPPLDQPCTFQNTATNPAHLTFLRSFPAYRDLDFATYLALTQKRSSRIFWAGELKLFHGAIHPRTGKRGVLVYFVYAEPAEPLTVEELAALDARLAGCAPYARDLLVLVATDADQERDFAALAPALAARGVDFVAQADLRPGVTAESYSLGESYGYLEIVPPGAGPVEVGLRDILVTESASEELGLVAGLVTTLPQNVHSHLNLRLREKKLPNARVADVFADPTLATLDGRLARLIVREAEVKIEPATLADAELHWQSRRPTPRPLSANLAEKAPRGFAGLRAAGKDAYGVKAANLGELFHVLPAAHRPDGFALPFSLAHDWLIATGVRAEIDAFLADPRSKTDANVRRAGLARLRRTIEDAPLPSALVTALEPAARAAFGAGFARTPIRFRSSSNAEDGEQASGAGLYDSARGCFADDLDGDLDGPSHCLSEDERRALTAELDRRRAELTAHPERRWLPAIIADLASDVSKERPVARALKKVWASLWNDRAFEERAYFGMDHGKAEMAVAVSSAFVGERLDAVAVTHLPSMSGPPLYRVVSQRDGLPVVRPPDPTLVAETLTFRRGPMDALVDPQLVTMSSLATGPLWTDAQRAELARLIFQVHDHFATVVYAHLPRPSLDLEIKLTADSRIVIKQARPFIDVAPLP